MANEAKEAERRKEVLRVYRANFDRPYRRMELRIQHPNLQEFFDAVDNTEKVDVVLLRAILPT